MSTFDKHSLNGFIDKHLVHTYDSDWNYRICVENGHTSDYRIHSGIIGNRWVKDQEAYIARAGENIYKISWTKPIDTDISLIVNLDGKPFHGTIFFLHRIMNNLEKTICFQNDHIPPMNSYRDAGPTYPMKVIDKFVTATFTHDCDADNDKVTNCPASELPVDFPASL